MKNRVVWLTVLLIGFIAIGPSHAQDVVNILDNGGFETGDLTNWTGGGDPGSVMTVVDTLAGADIPEDPIEGNFCLHIVVEEEGENSYDSQLKYNGLVFEEGKIYTLCAFIKSDDAMQVRFKPQLSEDPYTAYGAQTFTTTNEWQEYYITTPPMPETVDPANHDFHFNYGVGEFWIDGIRWYEGEYVAPPPTTAEERAAALDPNPSNGAPNVANDAALSWKPGEFAATHDVYLGKTFEDVNDASRANPMNVLVGQNQLPTTHQPPDPLEFGQTYYWRIDEVNAPPDTTVYKGAIWSFTVETYAFPLTNITATASSSAIDQGPENTVNGSGLDADDQHSTIGTDMWLSDAAGPQPSWIQYEFGKAHALLEMWVWNSNQLLESVIGIGAKDVTIEHSQDGEVWTTLGDVEFTQATSLADYTHNTTVDLRGVFARYIRLTINSNWFDILEQYGLSEVRFFHVPVQATDPEPASGASDVALDVVLDWRAGREAALHEVYFSSDEQAVIDGTALVTTVSETSYQVGPLEYGQIYYWKINEVNDAAATSSWEGDVWGFSTTEYMPVDDFESYSTENPIWFAWNDGLGAGSLGSPDYVPGNGTGSMIGDDSTDSYTEESIVHGGSQSMPYWYDNNKQGYSNYSEAQHTFDATRDWTEGGLTQLSLWFRGHAGSVGSFVEGPIDTFTMTGSGVDITGPSDEFHFAHKVLTGAGSIVAQVESIQNTNDWAKAGIMIRETLDPGSAHAMVFVTPVQGVVFEYRPATGYDNVGAAGQQTGVTAPHWLKIERSISGTFSVYHSTDGSTWQALGTPQNIQMSANVYIGLALTSHDADLTCEAVFSNVTTSASVSGQWMNQDIGIASNDPEPVYVALADSLGAVGVVAHEDPGATQISTWTEWSIDLTEFSDQGVNLAGIQKMMLGIGNRSNPVAGGSGKMYFDDITVGNPVPAREIENLLINGGFETGELAPWTGGGSVGSVMTVVDTLDGAEIPENPIEGDYCLHVVVEEKGENTYDSQLKYTGLIFEAGKIYTLSAFIKSDDEMQIRLNPQLSQDPYTSYGAQTFTVTNEWQEYYITTPPMTETVTPAGLDFHFNYGVGEFWIDDVKFYEGEPPPPSGAVVLGDFEGGLDGWWARDATLSFSTTGATLGTQALQIDGPGDWHQNALLDLKPHRVALGQPGATITADVTAFDADMNTTWMNVEMVINGQNNDDAGANNNIDWQSLGSHAVTRNGQPQTLTWVLPEALTTAISGVDDNIGWFELVLVSNLDGASVTKFYIDNILLVTDAP